MRLSYFIVLFTLATEIYGKRNYYFKVDACEVESTNPGHCEVNCTLIQSGKIKTITGYLTTSNWVETFGAAAEIIARPLNGGSYMTILNQSIPNLCPFLGTKKIGGLAQIAVDGLSKYGKIPRCPVEAGLYYLEEYYLSPENFPPYVPEAEFKIKGVFFGVNKSKVFPCANWYIAGRVEMVRNTFWKTPK